jgi:alpha-L-fucosidase 2
MRIMRLSWFFGCCFTTGFLFFIHQGNICAQSEGRSAPTAWRSGRFEVDVAGVLSRSDIVLGHPNAEPREAMPLGNGNLGVSVWSAGGFTAQLNRADTLPERLSPGQVVLPGLSALTGAKDYAGRLNLYEGEFQERGGGMTATAYVQPDTDTLVVDVTGAAADEPQTVQLKLWQPRTPHAIVDNKSGLLAEGWVDNHQPESSGRPFGSLSGITADARNVSVAVTDPMTITVTFTPYADGHFRILVAAPHYDGVQDPLAAMRPALSLTASEAHRVWWHDYWRRATVVKISSTDGAGEYLENLRNIYLFAAAAEKGGEYPGTQAGVADMLSSGRDSHRWASSAFWHWNLRMMVAANLGAGLPELDAPYFNLYRENLPSIEEWTKEHMRGRPGACVPETMRFNGRGMEYEDSISVTDPGRIARNCDADFHPYYNSRTLSTGAEVSLWIWQRYLATNDRAFLAENYPVIAASARFLRAYQTLGSDGRLHTSPSNAHETQWDVSDPTTDIAAAMALYPITIQAARLLGRDANLVRQLQDALPRIPPFPRRPAFGEPALLPPSTDAAGQDVIAESYLPAAPIKNGENIGLEPVWPYGLIGDTSPLFDLAKRTYGHRRFNAVADWSFDPLQAARLDMGGEVESTLVKITEHSQNAPNGLANWNAKYGEFYVEQVGVVAAALQEALVQDYDGTIRIAPAIPSDWDVDGSVYVRGKTKVDVQVRAGTVTTAVIECGSDQQLRVRNPWPGSVLNVLSGKTGAVIMRATNVPVLLFRGTAGTSYVLERVDMPFSQLRFAPVEGNPAKMARHLGKMQIGLD